MKNKKEQILNTSDEAAKFVTGISGWVDRHGRFFGQGKDAEAIARYSGCTHIVCPDCGKACPSGYTRCSDCREKKAIVKYQGMERREWDKVTPLYADTIDAYFFNEDELFCFIEEQGCDIKEMRLIICEPVALRQIDTDYWCDEMPEDGELPDAVLDALDNLNAVIRDEDPLSWQPGKYAVKKL